MREGDRAAWRITSRSEKCSPANAKTKYERMKTNIANLLRLPLTAAVFAALLAIAAAADYPAGKGASQLMKSSTPAADRAKPAMACGQCQDQFVGLPDPAARGAKRLASLGVKHLCPSCETTIATVGQGKSKHDVSNHSCGSSEDRNAACCGAGSIPTAQMKCPAGTTPAR